jgi:hypothetical protein
MAAVTTGYAVGMGALRGLAGAAAYALLLGPALAVADALDGYDVEVGDAAFGLYLSGLVLPLTAPVGVLAGCALGPVCRAVALRLPPPRASLACFAGVFLLALVVLPYVPLGHHAWWGPELVLLSVLPALCGGVAAGRHAAAMSRQARLAVPV